MAASSDDALGREAVRRGSLTPSQLEAALAEQGGRRA